MRLAGILFTLGGGAGLIAILMVIPLIYSAIIGAQLVSSNFVIGILVSFFVSIGLILSGSGTARHNAAREGELIMTMLLFWLILPLLAAVPLIAASDIDSYTKAYWEASSSLTTTGASLITQAELTPKPLILWRAMLGWLGGFFTLSFAITVLAPRAIGGLLTSVSLPTSPLHQHDEHATIAQRLLRVQKIILPLYCTMTLIGGGVIWIGGASAFDAICLAMSAISTTGTAPVSAPLTQAYAPASLAAITILSILGAVNLPLLYALVRRGGVAFITHNREFRYFLIICAIFAGLSLLIYGGSVLGVLMQIVSLSTTTAFHFMPLNELDSWSPMWLLLPCIVGGMSLSTAGGVKIQRLLIIGRDIGNELIRLTHPASVHPLRYNDLPISNKVRSALWSYFAAFLVFIGLGLLICGLLGVALPDAWTMTLAFLSNSGAALALTQTTMGDKSSLLYVFTAFLMIAGRVELLIFLVLLSPGFWRFTR